MSYWQPEPLSDELERFIGQIDCPNRIKTRFRTACHTLELKTIDDLKCNLLDMARLPNMGRVTLGHIESALNVVKKSDVPTLLRLSYGG